MKKVSDKIFDLVADELSIKRTSLTTTSHFYDDLGCSMDTVEIFMRCEEEIHIEITNDEYGQIETIGDLISLVERKLKDKPLLPGNLEI